MASFAVFSSNGLLDLASLLNVLALLLVWTAIVIVYRLGLSPLAKFPGPKLAALTGWYETYFECLQRGKYWVEIERMHEQYGPIVRISPWELHVNDPEWSEPYKVSSRVDKYHWYYKFVGTSDAAFGTSDHEMHRVRRKAQQGYFTLDAVRKFDPSLAAIEETLSKRLREFKGTGQPVNLSNAFRSLATDVVTEFSFQKSYGLLEQPDFAATFQKTIRNFPELGLWHRHFGVILDVMDLMPRWLVKIMNPTGIDVLDFFNDLGVRTQEITKAYKQGEAKHDLDTDIYERSNIIHQMLDSLELPMNDKTDFRLALEVRTFVGAGTETTGNTLSVLTYHLLANPNVAQRLREEVIAAQKATSQALTYQQLAKLPYLSSIILEGHRMSSSVAGRLPRVNTKEAIRYKDKIIPINTPVSMTQRLTHFNSTIFPNPDTFLPERWMNPDERKRLEKYVQPFGKGSRSCIGLHLASSELFVTIAKLFSEFDLELFDTTFDDVKQVHDFFSPFPESEKGLRVLIK